MAPWKVPSIYQDYKIKHAYLSGNPESAGVHFTDQTVCRAFMTGLCPHTLFTNTVSIDIEYLPRVFVVVLDIYSHTKSVKISVSHGNNIA